MKNIALIVLLGFSIAAAQAQTTKLSKDQAKKWNDKKKEMSPEEFHEIKETYPILKGETEGLKRQIANMSRTVSDDDTEIARLKAEIDTLRLTLGNAEKPAATNEKDASFKSQYTKGMLYKVQVGAYRKIDLSQYKGKYLLFTVEEEEGGIYRYILGYFQELEEAKNFKAYLRNIGLKDAFIVPYKDNVRLPVEEHEKYNN